MLSRSLLVELYLREVFDLHIELKEWFEVSENIVEGRLKLIVHEHHALTLKRGVRLVAPDQPLVEKEREDLLLVNEVRWRHQLRRGIYDKQGIIVAFLEAHFFTA